MILKEGLGFSELSPFFTDKRKEIQAFFTSSIEGGTKESALIDFYIKKDDEYLFKSTELYKYLSHADARIRDVGLKIITLYPDRFADLNHLILLSSSSDRRIRELIIKQVWEQFKVRGVTLHWKPFSPSRIRQASISKRRVISRFKPRKSTNSVQELHQLEWVIGQGIEHDFKSSSIKVDSFVSFLKHVLFRLPPTSPSWANAGRLLDVIPAWQNKVWLIEAVTNVAISDIENGQSNLADQVIAVLEKLKSSRGKTEFEAALVAETKIKLALRASVTN